MLYELACLLRRKNGAETSQFTTLYSYSLDYRLVNHHTLRIRIPVSRWRRTSVLGCYVNLTNEFMVREMEVTTRVRLLEAIIYSTEMGATNRLEQCNVAELDALFFPLPQ